MDNPYNNDLLNRLNKTFNEELDKLIASVQSEAGIDLPAANKENLEEEKEKEKEIKQEKKVIVEA